MKTKDFTKKGLVMLTMMFALVMNAEGQPKQVIEFQTVMSMHETTYKNFIRGGKYKEAIAIICLELIFARICIQQFLNV